jgi:S1-C subfamily serine protease
MLALVAADAPRPGDDATFRPTVMVRKGKGVGSGTVIASRDDETIVLTAAHVVDDPGPLTVEFFRFNVGLERARTSKGFPRRIPATIAAADPGADLAILRVRGLLALPYIARLAEGADPPISGTEVTSIGFDHGDRPVGVSTRIRRVDQVDLDKGGGPRPFLVTDHPPELGRSGGGLFRLDGSLVGVCVGRTEIGQRKIGLFTSLENIRKLLKDHEDLATAVARAETRGRPPRSAGP